MQILSGEFTGRGAPDKEIQKKVRAYFRREKPYFPGMVPFPLGIESRFMKHYDPNKKKDVDFSAIFGQEVYPVTRRYTRELTDKFCKKNSKSFEINSRVSV